MCCRLKCFSVVYYMCADSLLLFKEKKCPIFKWIVSVPFPSEISTNFGAEHFSYLYRVALKNSVLQPREDKGTPFIDAPLSIIATKLIYYCLAQSQNKKMLICQICLKRDIFSEGYINRIIL